MVEFFATDLLIRTDHFPVKICASVAKLGNGICYRLTLDWDYQPNPYAWFSAAYIFSTLTAVPYASTSVTPPITSLAS